ncbi:MAG: DUF819 family protein [Candidatus Latescibacterota bacterium]|nr:MAG: DUF819 family protein [Candidatus Latescibacterota bacterium]
MFQSPAAVLTVLSALTAFFFWLEARSGWRLFRYVPPLIFIYGIPVVLSNTGVIPTESPVYSGMRSYALPAFLTLMLLSLDCGRAVRVMGRGIFVMLAGSAGVVIGAPIAYAIVRGGLSPDAWKGFGALAGSWIGGTGNLAAVAGALEAPPEEVGLAVLADNLVYIVWLPLLLASKNLADRFGRFSKVSAGRLDRMEAAAKEAEAETRAPAMRDYLALATAAFAATWLARSIAGRLPPAEPVLSTGTWEVLLITTIGIALSFTPMKRVPGSQPLSTAMVYLFVGSMGARAELSGLDRAPWFVAGAFIWIAVHGIVVLAAARALRVDVHTAAISSAANIGGIASAPIVAAHHRKTLVPVSILMALIGYAIGNYLAILTAQLCYWVGH